LIGWSIWSSYCSCNIFIFCVFFFI